MPTQKSPGGSLFPYFYKNGELFGLHLGSFFSDEEAVIDRMKAEAAFLRSNIASWVSGSISVKRN